MVVRNVHSLTLSMDDDGSDDDNDAVVGYDDDNKRSGDDEYGHGKCDTTVTVLAGAAPKLLFRSRQSSARCSRALCSDLGLSQPRISGEKLPE